MEKQKAGTVAVIALISAIVSCILTFSGNPVWGLLIALIAIAAGIIGIVVAASPRIGGGLMSIFAILLGLFDIGAAILVIIGVIIF